MKITRVAFNEWTLKFDENAVALTASELVSQKRLLRECLVQANAIPDLHCDRDPFDYKIARALAAGGPHWQPPSRGRAAK